MTVPGRPARRAGVRPAPVQGSSTVLLVLIAFALATGAAASLLVGAGSEPAPIPAPSHGLIVPAHALALGLLVLFAAVAAFLVFYRLSGGSAAVPSRSIVTFLVAVLVACGFVLLFGFVGPCSTVQNGTNGTSSGNNGSYPPPPNGTNGTFAGGTFSFLSLPPWAGFVVLAGLVALVALVAVPALYRHATLRSAEGRADAEAERAAARDAVVRASRGLALGVDPREVIEGLYAELLQRLAPFVDGIDPATPEEIRSRHLLRLGIRPDVAGVLTRLFEESRYSSHPLGPATVDRARWAMDAAARDLDRDGGPT